ncbi:AlpA family phage regulatory protein [Vibrio sp.]|nr:AlpA family phage regulatory protein [Vibrio sp.]
MTRNIISTHNQLDRILSIQEVSSLMGKSAKTLWRWHSKEKCFPKPLSVNGRAIGWRKSTIENFLDQQSKENA